MSGLLMVVFLFRDRESLVRILKLLRNPRIDLNEPIPLGCVAWRAGTTTLFRLGS